MKTGECLQRDDAMWFEGLRGVHGQAQPQRDRIVTCKVGYDFAAVKQMGQLFFGIFQGKVEARAAFAWEDYFSQL